MNTTKRDVIRFNRQVATFLIDECHAVRATEDHRDVFTLTTIVGPLTLTTWSPSIGGNYLTVFGRFEDIEAARELCDINPHSGKWNHHYGAVEPEMALAAFKNTLARVLMPEPEMESK